jgi:hypothetical protein
MKKNTEHELQQLLDGEAAVRPDGFDVLACSRTLFVPYHVTQDAAAALLICKLRGLVTAKLFAMDPARAWCLYMTTVPEPEQSN